MLDNHILLVNIYKDKKKITQIKIEFPQSEVPMNIRIWTELVNNMYSQYCFKDEENTIYLSDILEYVWEPYLYVFTYLENQSSNVTEENKYYKPETIIKNVRILNINKSNKYDVELESPFTLLTFFGKPFTGMPNMHMSNMKHNNQTTDKCGDNHDDGNHDVCNCCCDPECHCEQHNMPMDNLQQVFVYAGTRDGTSVPEVNNNFTLMVYKKETYIGFCDGFNNDNFKNFSVKKNTSEKYCYYNGDATDAHPFHFHLSSGYVINEDQNLDTTKTNLLNYVYYSKDNYAIPPQSNITVRVKFDNYSSEDGEIPYLGFMYHCHFMAHHDMNMMSEYFVYNDKKKYFY
jgi:hypothetical protein